jgi:hypothetical protein
VKIYQATYFIYYDKKEDRKKIYRVTYCYGEDNILDIIRKLNFGEMVQIKMLEMDDEEWSKMK